MEPDPGTSAQPVAERDLLAELDSIKAEADRRLGPEDPVSDTTVTPRSRLAEHYAAFRHSLAHALDRGEDA